MALSFDMAGPVFALALGMIGASVGCALAGMALHGKLAVTDEGSGQFIAITALPSSMGIYGFVLMLLMKNQIVGAGFSPLSGLIIGVMAGIAICFAAIFQGMAGATAIQAIARNPAAFGKAFAVLGIIESFALFSFVFALLLIY